MAKTLFVITLTILGNEKKTLAINKGDNPTLVANQFCDKYGLDVAAERYLKDLITQKMKTRALIEEDKSSIHESSFSRKGSPNFSYQSPERKARQFMGKTTSRVNVSDFINKEELNSSIEKKERVNRSTASKHY